MNKKKTNNEKVSWKEENEIKTMEENERHKSNKERKEKKN